MSGGMRLRPHVVALRARAAARAPRRWPAPRSIQPSSRAGAARRRGSTAARRRGRRHGRPASSTRSVSTAARVTRHDQIAGVERDRSRDRRPRTRPDRAAAATPRRATRAACGRRRQRRVHDEGRRRRVVEQQQHLREQAVAAGQVDDAAAAEAPPHAPRHLPRFEEFLPRQTAGLAHRAAEHREERRALEPAEIVARQPVGGRAGEGRRRQRRGMGHSSAIARTDLARNRALSRSDVDAIASPLRRKPRRGRLLVARRRAAGRRRQAQAPSGTAPTPTHRPRGPSSTFSANCAECHTLGGTGDGQLVGTPFWEGYSQKTVGELADLRAHEHAERRRRVAPAVDLHRSGRAHPQVERTAGGHDGAGPEHGRPPAHRARRTARPRCRPTAWRASWGACPKSGSDWVLTNATAPERIDAAGVGKEDATRPLGNGTITLKFVLSRLDSFVGQRMSASGILLGTGRGGRPERVVGQPRRPDLPITAQPGFPRKSGRSQDSSSPDRRDGQI